MFRYLLVVSLVLKFNCGYLLVNETNRLTDKHLLLEYVEYRDCVGNVKRYPTSVDWRYKDGVSPIKYQAQCNACWAFAIVGTIESHARIHLRYKENLSEQFLIDCLKSSPGCRPMSLLAAYGDIVATLGGVLAERDYYPYENQKRECRWQRFNQNNNCSSKLNAEEFENQAGRLSASPSVLVTGFSRVPSDEHEIAYFIANVGPVTAAINPKRLFNYKGNYIDEPSEAECPGDDESLEHSVVIVGYNTFIDSGRKVDYWIIKNSWGEGFGDNGYYYLVRGRNACGIARDVSYPLIQKI